MTESNIHKDYLDILKKLVTSKKEHSEENLPLDSILNFSNILFNQISNTGELKLDAKVTAIHSDIFLKQFSRNVTNRKVDHKKFLDLVEEGKLTNYFANVLSYNKKCKFAKFINFKYSKINKERKVGEKIQRIIKDATTPSGQAQVKTECCDFIIKLEERLKEQSKILFYDLVLDPTSFCKTIENLFNVSISIRSKKIMFYIQNDIIYIKKYKEPTGNDKFDNHVILEIDYETYTNLIEKHKTEKYKPDY